MGGRTVAEAKETLSLIEFKNWLAYRRKRGSLNAGLHVEANLAQIALMMARYMGNKDVGFNDLAPHYDKIDPEPQELDIDSVFALLSKASGK